MALINAISAEDNMKAQLKQIMQHESFVNFHAYEKHVYHYNPDDFEHTPIDGFKSLWRSERGKEIFLGIVSNRYRVIQNWQLFSAIERVLVDIFGSLDNVAIVDEWSDNGAVCLRQYIMHDSVKQLDVNDRSRIAFRVIASNSFNGGKSATVLAGAIDFFCTNGMIIGEFDRLVTTHHTGLNIAKLTDFVRNAYDAFGRDFELNKKLLGISCTRKHAVRLLEKLNDTAKFKDNIGSALDDNIVHHGWNLWSVLSTATWWSSTREASWAVPNGEAASNNAPVRRLERQKEVRAWTKMHLAPLVHTPELVRYDVVEEAMP